MKIYNKRRPLEIPEGAVYVGRPSPWGNPFLILNEALDYTGSRDHACDRFESYAIERLERDPTWLDPLRGKDLVCWCAPQRCHAETLLRLANASPTP